MELGLFDYATDWLWVSGDMAALLLCPLGVSESGVMNLADGAIVFCSYLFWFAVVWRVRIYMARCLRWFCGLRHSGLTTAR